MAKIAWANVPDSKRVLVWLTYIVGIWLTTSWKILEAVKIDPTKRVKDLSEADLDKIRAEIWKIPTEVEVRRDQQLNIKRLQEIWSYRWYRHKVWLPCRWQATASNARTCKARSWKKRVAVPGKKW